MPDSRRHRGPHPKDSRLFAAAHVPALRQAVEELSWLLTRGYASEAAMKLVGDRYQLHKRQRAAVWRASCTDPSLERRVATRGAGPEIVVDGFNVLVTVEAALSGAVLLRGRDGLIRDLASVHGTWRRVAETERALDLLVAALGDAAARWVIDRPVSNSGRLAGMLRERGQAAEVVDAADPVLAASGLSVATADGPLLDRSVGGVDLVGPIVDQLDDAWLIDLG